MVQEQTKSTYGLSLTYEQADTVVTRAARMLLNYWSTFFDQMENNESFLLSRLKQINVYANIVKHDEYLSNLWLVWLGSRSEGVTLDITITRMEKVRVLIAAHPTDENGKESFSAAILPRILNDDSPAAKIKYLVRFQIAKLLASQLTEKLNRERAKKRTQPLDATYNGSPYMFAEKLNTALKEYK